MTIKEQIKILDDKIKQNQADYDLYRQNTRYLLCLLVNWTNMNM